MATEPDPDDQCPTCHNWTRQGKAKMAERSRQNPIYGTDFSKPLWQVVEDIRHQMSQSRGRLSDIHSAFPGWRERVEDVEGLLTCGIAYLYDSAREMEKAELKRLHESLGVAIRWRVRGIGLDARSGGTPCFLCGTTRRSRRSLGANEYMNNIAAFVSSKEEGEMAVKLIGTGAWLDYRDYEPNWIQVKVASCDEHRPDLERLASRWYIGPDWREA